MTMPENFPALVVTDGEVAIADHDATVLHDGAVTVRVELSSLNYKDALAVTGKGKILRASPMVPGIEYVGEVVDCPADGDFSVGDKVMLAGHDVGEKHSGGFAAYAKADPAWLRKLPAGLDPRHAALCGVAGITAALCTVALHDSGHVTPGGDIAVSGAAGGVGSFAVVLLSRLGYQMHAISRPAASDYLTTLGAAAVIDRTTMSEPPRPLEKARWAGAVDSVGSHLLARLLAETKVGGVVAACGLAGGHDLPTTVMPFILRGVRLDGINSVHIPARLEARAWELIMAHVKPADYDAIERGQVTLAGLPEAAEAMLAGNHNGRLLVRPTL